MSEWKETTLGEVINLKRGYDLPQSQRLEGNIPIYSSSGISGYHSHHKVSSPGVVTGRYGTIGSVFFADTPFWPHNTTLYVEDFKGSNEVFIYYFLKQIDWLKFSDKSAVPGVNRNDAHKENVLLPSFPEQKRIADVLSCLDAKIENLRRQNETLEQIAQTLFKHWFIDFEFPNADGKPYKSSNGAMFASELGDIPEGWKVGKLKDICEIINGFAFKSEDYREEGIKIIRTKNFDETGSIVLDNLTYISNSEVSKYKKFQLNKFDFLMVMVGASIGKSVIVTSHILPALQNQNMWNFRAIDTSFQIFLNQSLKLLILKHSGSSTGSAREFFRKDYFYEIQITLPDNIIIYQFQKAGLALLAKIDLNIRQIQTLTKTRDSLLSKLMSGQLRVKE